MWSIFSVQTESSLALLAQISTFTEGGDARVAGRRALKLQVPAVASGNATEAVVHNLSEVGLLVRTQAPLEVGETLEVELPQIGVAEAVVVWTRSDLAGCQFARAIPTAIVSAALLQSPPKEPVQTTFELPVGEATRHYATEGMDPSRALVIGSLFLSLLMVIVFIVALLTLPSSIV